MKKLLAFFAVSITLMPSAIYGDQDHDHGTPQETVEAFHAAMGAGNQERVLALLSPEVVIFESGGAETSREEYASHHLGADMQFSAATSRRVTTRQAGGGGDSAWVLTRSETTGRFRDRDIDALGVETMVLERGDDGWRIVHIHWSSRTRGKGH